MFVLFFVTSCFPMPLKATRHPEQLLALLMVALVYGHNLLCNVAGQWTVTIRGA